MFFYALASVIDCDQFQRPKIGKTRSIPNRDSNKLKNFKDRLLELNIRRKIATWKIMIRIVWWGFKAGKKSFKDLL